MYKDAEENIQKLEEDIRRKECELQQHYSQMGKNLLEIAECEQRTINRLVDEIIEARSKLGRIKGQTQCLECSAFNDADSRYCKRCGIILSRRTKRKEPENGSE